jgi:hypothetical protein
MPTDLGGWELELGRSTVFGALPVYARDVQTKLIRNEERIGFG